MQQEYVTSFFGTHTKQVNPMDLIRNDVTNKDGRDSWGTLYSQWWERLAFRHDCRKEIQRKRW